MKLDSKVKGGLAWTGLFVILAVPAADLLFGKDTAPSANLAVTSDTAQVKPAVAATQTEPKPAAVEKASLNLPVAQTDDPVEAYVGKGKKLPSYISDADSVPAAKPAAPVAPVALSQPVEVAAINPVQQTPPVPLPRSARPVAKAPVVASVPTAPVEQPLIVDEATLGPPDGAIEPFPLSDGGQASADDSIVSGDQLEEWDSGSLADYLERKGLLSEGSDTVDSEVVFNQRSNPQRRPLNDFVLF